MAPSIQMSKTSEEYKGKVTVIANIEATLEKADTVASKLEDIRKSALSDAEPDCVSYDITRFKHRFIVFEEYRNKDAITHHHEQKAATEFAGIKADDTFIKNVDVRFYEDPGEEEAA